MARELDDWIESYMEYTSNTEPPELYHKWIAVSCIAAALRRKCSFPWGQITFYPNFYVVLVGSSGRCRKGTAMGIGAGFLKHIGVKMASEAITREALIRELSEADDTQIDLANATMQHSTSITIYSQELTVFLGYDNKQLISDLTDWYDCRDKWTYRTKGMGTDNLTNVWVNLIGATTPQLIQSALPPDAIGGGLSSRMIFVYEEDKQQPVPFPFLSDNQTKTGEALMRDLQRIDHLEGEFKVTEGFLKRWGEWYLHQDANPPFQNNLNFEGYVNRRPNHVIKLCMIISAARRDDLVITSDTFDDALALLEQTEVKMAYTFSGFGKGASSEILSRIIRYLRRSGPQPVDRVYSTFYSDLESVQQLNDLMELAVHAGQVSRMVDGKGKQYFKYTG
jgi:hypothetical protein